MVDVLRPSFGSVNISFFAVLGQARKYAASGTYFRHAAQVRSTIPRLTSTANTTWSHATITVDHIVCGRTCGRGFTCIDVAHELFMTDRIYQTTLYPEWVRRWCEIAPLENGTGCLTGTLCALRADDVEALRDAPSRGLHSKESTRAVFPKHCEDVVAFASRHPLPFRTSSRRVHDTSETCDVGSHVSSRRLETAIPCRPATVAHPLQLQLRTNLDKILLDVFDVLFDDVELFKESLVRRRESCCDCRATWRHPARPYKSFGYDGVSALQKARCRFSTTYQWVLQAPCHVQQTKAIYKSVTHRMQLSIHLRITPHKI